MEYFYLIILILYSDNEPIYYYNKLNWKEYMNSSKEILSLFIKYDNNITEEVKFIKNENMLLIKGEEKLDCESILNKTIKALKYCNENYKFNYVLRTNISTFWVFDNLLNFLKLDNKRNYIYGWKVYHYTESGEKEFFISGTGIIIHYRKVHMLLDHNNYKCIMDDVEISHCYLLNGVEIKDALKHNPNYLIKFEFDNIEAINTHINNINDKNICFRIKSTSDREINDKYILDYLLSRYYNKKINNLDSKLYKLKNMKKITFFISKKANDYSKYFVDIIKKYLNKELIYSDDYTNSDIIISHITDRRKLFDPKSLNIIISGESKDIIDKYDIYIGTRLNTIAYKTIYVPYLYSSLTEHNKSINSIDYICTRQHFCAYMYSYDAPHRIKYFKLLNDYKMVHGIGKSCNNISITKNNDDGTYLDEAIKIYTNYKFVLALENLFQEGYFTEKIINPLIANSIPIYWGTPDVFNYINKKRVIYMQDFKSDDDLLKRIILLDNSEEEYNKILSEPIFIDHKKPEFIFSELEEKIKNILAN